MWIYALDISDHSRGSGLFLIMTPQKSILPDMNSSIYVFTTTRTSPPHFELKFE